MDLTDPNWWVAIATFLAAFVALIGYFTLAHGNRQRQREIRSLLRLQTRQTDAQEENNRLLRQQVLSDEERAKVAEHQRRMDILPRLQVVTTGRLRSAHGLSVTVRNIGKNNVTKLFISNKQLPAVYISYPEDDIEPGRDSQLSLSTKVAHALNSFGLRIEFEDVDHNRYVQQMTRHYRATPELDQPVFLPKEQLPPANSA